MFLLLVKIRLVIVMVAAVLAVTVVPVVMVSNLSLLTSLLQMAALPLSTHVGVVLYYNCVLMLLVVDSSICT